MKNELKLETETINYLLKTNEKLIVCVPKCEKKFDILFHDEKNRWFSISFDKSAKDQGLIFAHFFIIEFCCTSSSFYPTLVGGIGSFGSIKFISEFLNDATDIFKEKAERHAKNNGLHGERSGLRSQARKNNYIKYYAITEPMDEKTLQTFLLSHSIDY